MPAVCNFPGVVTEEEVRLFGKILTRFVCEIVCLVWYRSDRLGWYLVWYRGWYLVWYRGWYLVWYRSKTYRMYLGARCCEIAQTTHMTSTACFKYDSNEVLYPRQIECLTVSNDEITWPLNCFHYRIAVIVSSIGIRRFVKRRPSGSSSVTNLFVSVRIFACNRASLGSSV